MKPFLPEGLRTGLTAKLPGSFKQQDAPAKRVRNKYGAVRVELDGYRFDSKMEAKRYTELVVMQRAFQIHNLVVHPRFLLQQAKQIALTVVPAIIWTADFFYRENGKQCVEDCKGRDTREASLKHKLFQERFPAIELRIVRK